jgi:hypothetical protein
MSCLTDTGVGFRFDTLFCSFIGVFGNSVSTHVVAFRRFCKKSATAAATISTSSQIQFANSMTKAYAKNVRNTMSKHLTTPLCIKSNL